MDTTLFQIDTHVHILTEWRIQALCRWIKRIFVDHTASVMATPDDLVNDLKLGGITHFFNMVYPLKEEETGPLNAFNVTFCQNTPGAIPFAGIHQDTPKKAALAEKLWIKDNVAGFKLHPFVQKFHILDSRMDDFYGFLNEAKRPLFLHTGFEKAYESLLPMKDLQTFLDRFPQMPVVFVHMAYPELEKAFEFLGDYPNLYLDATGIFGLLRPSLKPHIEPNLKNGEFERVLQKYLVLYKERILFGSDHPVGWGHIQRIFKDIFYLPVAEDIQDWLRYRAAMTFIDRYYPGFDWNCHLQSGD